MPTTLYARVRMAAKASGQSMSAELLQRIERSFEPDDRQAAE